MSSVFTNTSAVLDKEIFEGLGWQQFSKTVDDFFAYRGKILDAEGKPLEKYLGMKGYARFAQDYGGSGTRSNMSSVFTNTSAVLDKKIFELLGWKKFEENS